MSDVGSNVTETNVTGVRFLGPSRALRLFGLCVLSLILLIPLMMIGGIAGDRMSYRATAERDIAASWGGAQTITGPMLAVPLEATFTRRTKAEDGTFTERTETRRSGRLLLLPERLETDTVLVTERRVRGLFDVPVYRSENAISASFDAARLTREIEENERLLWDDAELLMGIAWPQALRGDIALEAGEKSLGFEPGTGITNLNGITARIGDPRQLGDISIRLSLNGSRIIRIAPAGRVTTAAMAADWPHPSFSGAFLPSEREVTPDGFVATWEVPHLARSVPQVMRDPGAVEMINMAMREPTRLIDAAVAAQVPGWGGEGLSILAASAFGVDLYQPVDLYQRAERAAKYGILFIGLTFAVLFLMERAATRRLHVANYALVGAAQCVFFLLLLSFAERIGFGPAYLAATVATVGLLTYYAWSGLGLGRMTGALTAALSVLYAILYLILAAEDDALLAGSLLAFAAVAITMYATRNEDWGAVTLPRRKPRAGTPEAPETP